MSYAGPGADLLGAHLTKFFRTYLVGELGRKDNTVSSYRDCVKLYLRFLESTRGVPPERVTAADAADRETVLEFLSWLESERGCSARTRNQRLASLKTLFRFLGRERPDLLGPCAEVLDIKAKEAPEREIGFLTGDEMRALLTEPRTDTASGRRDMVLMSVLYDTGCRVQELCDVHVRDLKLGSDPQVKLHGKGDNVRYAPLMAPTADLLRSWLDERGGRDWGVAPQDEHLFHSSRSEHMTRWCVEAIVDSHVAGIRERDPGYASGMGITPHVFRHSKASHLVQAKVNLIYVRDLLGHASVRTTEIYARLDMDSKRAEIEAAYEPLTPGELPDWTEDDSLMGWLNTLGNR